jgi:hypothetical protein
VEVDSTLFPSASRVEDIKIVQDYPPINTSIAGLSTKGNASPWCAPTVDAVRLLQANRSIAGSVLI